MRHSYKIKLCYKGTGFCGWQVQADTKFKSIQGELEKALAEICKSNDIKTLGAGRTDAGVHAFGQVARLNLPIEIAPQGIINGVNSLIDPSIRILKCEKVEGKYNPISESLSKEYLYLFNEERKLSPFAHDFLGNVGFKLDFDKMREACKLFIGKKDFINFRCTGTDTPDTVREILEVELTKEIDEGYWKIISPEYYMLRVKGTGFMKQMVRLIVGAIWMIGRDKISLDYMEKNFDKEIKGRFGPVAPASGLYLNKIEYEDGF